ncbi:MAG: hypothetical protein ACOYOB_21635 [Myxococcota bacterium]
MRYWVEKLDSGRFKFLVACSTAERGFALCDLLVLDGHAVRVYDGEVNQAVRRPSRVPRVYARSARPARPMNAMDAYDIAERAREGAE